MTHPCPMCGDGEHEDWRPTTAPVPGHPDWLPAEHKLENSGVEMHDGFQVEPTRRVEHGNVVTRRSARDPNIYTTMVGPAWEDLPDAWGNPGCKPEEEAP